MHFCDGTYCHICLEERKAEVQPIVDAVKQYRIASQESSTPIPMPGVVQKLATFRSKLSSPKVHRLASKPSQNLAVIPSKSNIRYVYHFFCLKIIM